MSTVSKPCAADHFRDRCEHLGLSVYRCDVNGTVLEEPQRPGPLGLWLRCGTVLREISTAVESLADEDSPGLIEICPGCWLIPLVERHRRRRAGYCVAMALGPACFQTTLFAEACASASLDPQAVHRAAASCADFDEPGARHVADMLAWMYRDLSDIDRDAAAVAQFTHKLTEAYETTDVLYSLGRSMRDLTQPARFFALVCQRLCDMLPFEWIAIHLLPNARVDALLSDGPMICGEPPAPEIEMSRAMAELVDKCGPGGASQIIDADHRLAAAEGSPVVAQPVLRDGVIAGLLVAGDKTGDDPQISSNEIQLIEAAGGYIGAFLENAALYADQQEMFMGTLRALTASIDAKDRYTCGHSERVAFMASRLALAAGMNRDEAERVHIAGIVHDVGKIGVPEAVLTKPGRLTDEEFDQIKMHPEIGHRILKDIPQFQDVLPGVLYHHERWDGRGYPHGLAGEKIPYIARVLCVADTFDAMSSTRSYRAALPRQRVLEEIERCAGSQFDADLARTFLTLDLEQYDVMVARHAAEQGVAQTADRAA